MQITPLIRAAFPASFSLGSRSYRSVSRVLVQPRSTLKRQHEPWLDRIYETVLRHRPGAVVDVGVNKMQTLFKVLSLDPERRYVGFEPQIPAALLAREFASRNTLSNVEIVAAALGDACGIARLQMRSASGLDASASVSDIRRSGFYSHFEHVPVLRGDDCLPGLCPGGIALMNIDVEGAEIEVLRGCTQTLRAFGPVISFEVLNDWSDPAGDAERVANSARRDERARQVTDLLRGLEFDILAVQDDGLRPIDEIRRIVSNKLSLCNYLAVNRAKIEEAGPELSRFFYP